MHLTNNYPRHVTPVYDHTSPVSGGTCSQECTLIQASQVPLVGRIALRAVAAGDFGAEQSPTFIGSSRRLSVAVGCVRLSCHALTDEPHARWLGPQPPHAGSGYQYGNTDMLPRMAGHSDAKWGTKPDLWLIPMIFFSKSIPIYTWSM